MQANWPDSLRKEGPASSGLIPRPPGTAPSSSAHQRAALPSPQPRPTSALPRTQQKPRVRPRAVTRPQHTAETLLSSSPEHEPQPRHTAGHTPPGILSPPLQWLQHGSRRAVAPGPMLTLREARFSPRWLWQRAQAWGKPEPEPGKKAELCSSTQPHLPGQPQRVQNSLLGGFAQGW